MTTVVKRLDERARASVVAHFLELPAKDRTLRFGTPLGQAGIARYVDGIDLDRDAMFGVRDEELGLVGVAHLAVSQEVAELGLSVLPAHRGFGLGGALFARAAAHARSRCVPRLFMRCLAGNAPILRLARRFGMDIAWDDGYADAILGLSPASLATNPQTVVTQTYALYDRVVKALVPVRARIASVPDAGAVRRLGPDAIDGGIGGDGVIR